MNQPWKWLIGSLHFYSLRHEEILNVATAVKPVFNIKLAEICKNQIVDFSILKLCNADFSLYGHTATGGHINKIFVYKKQISSFTM